MIYPQKLSSKNKDIIINILLLCSIVISLILLIINRLTTPNIPWSSIVISSIIYVWITVTHFIKRNTNIASHVLVQLIAISIILFYIDKKLSFYGWSINIGIPIIVIISNFTMLILSIVSYKKYQKYAIYQLIIVGLSILQIILVTKGIMKLTILNQVALGISLFNFVVSLFFSYKDFYRIIICKFHI